MSRAVREVAVVLHALGPRGGDRAGALYGVRVRSRGWIRWSRWRELVSARAHEREYAWAYPDARAIADQALEHGWVPGAHDHEAIPICELHEDG